MTVAEVRSAYVGAYSDFTPSGWAVAPAGDHYVVSMPGGHQFDLPRGTPMPLDWYQRFEGAQVSGRLWHRSLRYLLPVALEHGDWGTVREVVAQVGDILDRSADEPSLLGMNSLDHAIALELRTMCVLAAALDMDEGVPEDTRAALERDIQRVVTEAARTARAPGFRLPYNHGIMLGLALLHATLVFGWEEQSEVVDDLNTIKQHLELIIDDDGLVRENTPQYQRLYVDIVDQLAALTSATSFQELSEWFAERKAAVTSAYRRLVGVGRVVPSRGDAPRSGEREYDPLFGTLFSHRQGIYFRSEPDGWMYVTSGANSPVHKQMDDTAVSLHLDGVDVLIDAGLFDYDAANSVSVGCRTQPGHSGLFFPSLDDKPQHWFYPADGPARVDASLTRYQDGDEDILRARYVVAGGRSADRTVAVRSLWEFSIRDAASSMYDSVAVRRFLIPEAGEFTFRPDAVIVDFENLRMEIRGRQAVALDARLRRGYEASVKGKLMPCWVLELPIPTDMTVSELVFKIVRTP